MGLDNPLHIAILVVILLVVFGAKRLPEMGRSIGTGMREFKDSISSDSTSALPQTTTPQQAPVQSVAAQPPAAAPPIGGQVPVQPVPTSQPVAQPASAPVEPTHSA
jgi:sec-independent protein translocase protein TatA